MAHKSKITSATFYM